MSISVAGTTVTFTTTAGSEAVARSEITTASPDSEASFQFETARRPLRMRVGSTAGGQEIVADITLYPGTHVITFTPGVSPYYVEFRLPDIGYVGSGEGKATLTGFQTVAAGALTLATPWAEGELRTLRMEQSYDVVWIATRRVQTRVLERRGAKSWSLRRYQPEDGPFDTPNLTTTTLASSSQTGQTTLTASAPLFRSGHVGAMFRLTHAGQYVVTTLDALDDAGESIRVTGQGDNRKFQVSVTGTFTGTATLQRSVGNELSWVDVQSWTTTATATIDDDLDDQVIYYRVKATAWASGSATVTLTHANGITEGVARIVSVEADNSATADIFSPIGKTDATLTWSICSWSQVSGWPSAAALEDGRLWMGRDDRVWGSKSDEFEKFAIGAEDSAAISRRVTGGHGSVQWMVGVDRLVMGMDFREAEISSNALGDVIVPSNVRPRTRSRRGSANAQGKAVDENVVFIGKSRQKMFRMTLEGDGYRLDDLTRLHSSIAGDPGTSNGFLQVGVQYAPEPRIWSPCDDGRIAILLFDENEGVAAWFRLKDDGDFYESVCCLPGSPEDSIYLSVRRNINGSAVRFIEKLAPEAWADMEEVWRLRSAALYQGVSTTAITGLDHLEGESVHAWTNGYQQGPFTVSGGAVTLTYAATYAIVGKLYTGRYKSPRLAAGSQMGSALTQDKKSTRLGMLIHRTAPGALKWGANYTTMDTLKGANPSTYGAALEEITADVNYSMQSATLKDARVCIEMPTAGPATVLGLVPHIEVNEKSA